MKTNIITAALAAMALAAPAAAQDAKAGEKAFVQCKACHSVVKGQNRIGPSLAGVVGRKSASVAGFSYSAAMKAKGVSWTEANLDTYLTKPAVEREVEDMVAGVGSGPIDMLVHVTGFEIQPFAQRLQPAHKHPLLIKAAARAPIGAVERHERFADQQRTGGARPVQRRL